MSICLKWAKLVQTILSDPGARNGRPARAMPRSLQHEVAESDTRSMGAAQLDLSGHGRPEVASIGHLPEHGRAKRGFRQALRLHYGFGGDADRGSPGPIRRAGSRPPASICPSKHRSRTHGISPTSAPWASMLERTSGCSDFWQGIGARLDRFTESAPQANPSLRRRISAHTRRPPSARICLRGDAHEPKPVKAVQAPHDANTAAKYTRRTSKSSRWSAATCTGHPGAELAPRHRGLWTSNIRLPRGAPPRHHRGHTGPPAAAGPREASPNIWSKSAPHRSDLDEDQQHRPETLRTEGRSATASNK